MNTIQVEVKSVYGVDLIYPVNMAAKQFTSLTGKRTLAVHDIATIKELGFTIEVVNTSDLLGTLC